MIGEGQTRNANVDVYPIIRVGNWVQTVITMLLGLVLLDQLKQTLIRLSFDNPYLALSRIQFSETYILTFVALYLWRRHHTQLKSVFDRIKIVDNIVRPSKKQERQLAKKTTEWMLLFTLALLIHMTTFHMTEGTVIFRVISYVIQGWLMVQVLMPDIIFWTLLMLSGYYIQNLNDELKKSSKAKEIPSAFHLEDREKSPFQQAERVRELREVLREIDLIIEDIDDIFGMRLALSMLHTLTDFIFFIFINITMVKYFTGSISAEITFLMIQSNFWMLIHIYRLFQVLNLGSNFAESGRKTSIVVHELLSNNMDDNPKKELAIFSLVLLHRKNEISGRGFDVDYTLIPTVISATVMHTMILLQFNLPGYENGIKPLEDLIKKL